MRTGSGLMSSPLKKCRMDPSPFQCSTFVPRAPSEEGFSLESCGLVEMGGIEPPSDGRPRGLLRAHPADYFSAPNVMQACCWMGSVD